ncbi:hypothetical protein BAE44_0024177, partial [Dichanthelium oligosanthes]
LGTNLTAWWCHADYSSSIITHRPSNGRLQIIAVRSLKGALITTRVYDFIVCIMLIEISMSQGISL